MTAFELLKKEFIGSVRELADDLGSETLDDVTSLLQKQNSFDELESIMQLEMGWDSEQMIYCYRAALRKAVRI